MNTDSQNTQTTLGNLFVVIRQNGAREEIVLRQLPLNKYAAAYKQRTDEIALTAFLCGHTKDWLEGMPPEFPDAIEPDNYEALHAAVKEMNAKGFFSFAARQEMAEQKRQESLFAALSNLPPETIAAAAQMGQSSASTNSSPMPRPLPRSA